MASSIPFTIRTSLTPPISFDLSSSGRSSSSAALWLKILKPSVDASLPVVGQAHYAPFGEPGGLGQIVFIVLVFLAGYGLYKAVGF